MDAACLVAAIGRQQRRAMAAAERQARRAGRVQPLPSVLPRSEHWQVRNAAIIQRLANGASMQTVAKGIRDHTPKGQQDSVPCHRSVHTPTDITSIRLDSRTRRGVAIVMGRRVETRRHRAEVGRFWIRDRSEGTSFKAAAAPSHMDR